MHTTMHLVYYHASSVSTINGLTKWVKEKRQNIRMHCARRLSRCNLCFHAINNGCLALHHAPRQAYIFSLSTPDALNNARIVPTVANPNSINKISFIFFFKSSSYQFFCTNFSLISGI